jgi:hypothetical protein
MLSLIRKVQLAFGSAVLTLLIVGGVSDRAIAVSSESDRWVRHTHEVLETLPELLTEEGLFLLRHVLMRPLVPAAPKQGPSHIESNDCAIPDLRSSSIDASGDF